MSLFFNDLPRVASLNTHTHTHTQKKLHIRYIAYLSYLATKSVVYCCWNSSYFSFHLWAQCRDLTLAYYIPKEIFSATKMQVKPQQREEETFKIMAMISCLTDSHHYFSVPNCNELMRLFITPCQYSNSITLNALLLFEFFNTIWG